MAIHPIDMATIYSQMDNVAKFSASQNQISQTQSIVANTIGADEAVQKAQDVQKVAEENTDTASKVNPDAQNSSGASSSSANDRKNQSQAEDAEKPHPAEIKDPRVGNLIDIAR